MMTTKSKTTDSTRPSAPAPINGNATPATSNDNAAGGCLVDTTLLVARADVVQYLRATLRRHGVAAQDEADAIADVQLAAIEAARTKRMPFDPAQWKALAATIAARWAIDHHRQTEARAKHDAGLRDPDVSAPVSLHEERDPVDTKIYLAALNDLFDAGHMPEHAAEILWAEAEQVPHAEIGAEVGVTETVVDNRLFRMRTTFRMRVAALGLLTLLLLLMATLWGHADRAAAPVVPTPPADPPSVRSVPGWDAGPPRPQNRHRTVRGKCVLPD